MVIMVVGLGNLGILVAVVMGMRIIGNLRIVAVIGLGNPKKTVIHLAVRGNPGIIVDSIEKELRIISKPIVEDSLLAMVNMIAEDNRRNRIQLESSEFMVSEVKRVLCELVFLHILSQGCALPHSSMYQVGYKHGVLVNQLKCDLNH